MIAIGVIGAINTGCSVPITDPESMSGIYTLERVSGRGPAAGTLILTRQGYAERRVRFLEADSTMSQEHLARGTAELHTDNSLYLKLKAMDPASEIPWTPDAWLTTDGVQIMYFDPLDGSAVIETYRRE